MTTKWNTSNKGKKYKRNYTEVNKDKIKEYMKAYREKNREKINTYQHQYQLEHHDHLYQKSKERRAYHYANNQDRIKEVQLKYREKHRAQLLLRSTKRSQSPSGKYSQYKAAAKSYNRLFNITFEQFMTFWQKPCHYCDDPITTIGLDRIDSSKGYTMENIISCCAPCNWSKNDHSSEKYIERCNKVAKIHPLSS